MKTSRLLALLIPLFLATSNNAKASFESLSNDLFVQLLFSTSTEPNPILSKKDLCNFSGVCRSWRRAASADKLWKPAASAFFRFDLFPEQLFGDNSETAKSCLAKVMGAYKCLFGFRINIRLEIGKKAHQMGACLMKNQLMVATELMGDVSVVRTYLTLQSITLAKDFADNDDFLETQEAHKQQVFIPTLNTLADLGSVYAASNLKKLAPQQVVEPAEDQEEL